MQANDRCREASDQHISSQVLAYIVSFTVVVDWDKYKEWFRQDGVVGVGTRKGWVVKIARIPVNRARPAFGPHQSETCKAF